MVRPAVGLEPIRLKMSRVTLGRKVSILHTVLKGIA